MAIGAAALVLAACSASGDEAAYSGADMDRGGVAVEDGSAADTEAPTPAEGASDEGGSDDSGSDGGVSLGEGLNLSDGSRSVITNGFVTLATEDPVGAVDQVTRMVASLDGWIEGMSMRAGSDTVDPYAHVVARIPSGDVGTALGRLTDVGELASVELDRQDVTLQVRDLAARIRAVEMSVERMEVLLAGASTTEDLVRAEQMLTARQSELEQLLSQQATLGEQVSMSTLTLDIVVPEEVPEPEPEPEERTGFLGGLANGWDAFLEFGSGALLVLGTLLPWFVFLGLLGLLAVWLRRVWVRSRPARPAPIPGATAFGWQGAQPGHPGHPGPGQPGHPGQAPQPGPTAPSGTTAQPGPTTPPPPAPQAAAAAESAPADEAEPTA